MDRVEQYTNAMFFASSNAHLLLLSFFCMSWAKIIFLVLERNIVTDTFFNDDLWIALYLHMTKKSCGWGCLKLVTFFEYNRPSFPIVSYNIVASQIQDLGIFD